MPTYTKETALYDTGKIGMDINEAKNNAKGYMTEVSNDGVFVHEYDTSDPQPTDTGVNGIHISSDVDIIRDGESVASYGTEARIGSESSGNLLARSNGIALRDGLIELATLQQSGMDINTYDADGNIVSIAHLGYDEGAAESGTETAIMPYYTFGTRLSGSTVGNYSVAEGYNVTASGFTSHAEGRNTVASDRYAHAEGAHTTASGSQSHAEGRNTVASGHFAHAEGSASEATGLHSHAEGTESVASGLGSHAQNTHTIADGVSQTAIGRYNKTGDHAFIIGNGTPAGGRSNAFTVDWSGNVNAAGKYRLGASGEYSLLLYYSVTTAKTTIQGNNGALCQATFTMPAPYTHVIGVRQVSTNHAIATGINTFGVDGDGKSGNTITCHAYVRNYNQSTITDETVTFELFLASL